MPVDVRSPAFGFNTTSLPLGPKPNYVQIKSAARRALREAKEHRKWQPPDSPRCGIYDLGNTSVQMIRINQRSRQRTSVSVLRGQSPVYPLTPEPNRHLWENSPRPNSGRHEGCTLQPQPSFQRSTSLPHYIQKSLEKRPPLSTRVLNSPWWQKSQRERLDNLYSSVVRTMDPFNYDTTSRSSRTQSSK